MDKYYILYALLLNERVVKICVTVKDSWKTVVNRLNSERTREYYEDELEIYNSVVILDIIKEGDEETVYNEGYGYIKKYLPIYNKSSLPYGFERNIGKIIGYRKYYLVGFCTFFRKLDYKDILIDKFEIIKRRTENSNYDCDLVEKEFIEKYEKHEVVFQKKLEAEGRLKEWCEPVANKFSSRYNKAEIEKEFSRVLLNKKQLKLKKYGNIPEKGLYFLNLPNNIAMKIGRSINIEQRINTHLKEENFGIHCGIYGIIQIENDKKLEKVESAIKKKIPKEQRIDLIDYHNTETYDYKTSCKIFNMLKNVKKPETMIKKIQEMKI